MIGTLSKGEYIVDIMNYLKYDAAVPGNHEFDYGMDQFLHIAKDLAKYPYISANFTGKDGKPYFDAYKIFEVKGVKVAFVGVCTPETFTKSTPTYFRGRRLCHRPRPSRHRRAVLPLDEQGSHCQHHRL